MVKNSKNTLPIDKTPFSVGFAEFLKFSRFTQEQIAASCGVSASVVSGWKSGRGLPTFESLRVLYSLGMAPVLMFGGAGGEFEKLFCADDFEDMGETEGSDLLRWWLSVLNDKNKSDVEKLYFFFMQANTLRGIIEDFSMSKNSMTKK